MPRLILASSSPRRRDLLQNAGYRIADIAHPDVDETPLPKELPHLYCARIAISKFKAVNLKPDEVALSCDTIVAMGRRIFGKPNDALEASKMLQSMSGRRHRVYSSLCVGNSQRVVQTTVMTTVQFKSLHSDEIQFHTESLQWQGKSGGYAIQGLAACYIKSIKGSVTNVIGLPMMEAKNLLEQFSVTQELELINS